MRAIIALRVSILAVAALRVSAVQNKNTHLEPKHNTLSALRCLHVLQSHRGLPNKCARDRGDWLSVDNHTPGGVL